MSQCNGEMRKFRHVTLLPGVKTGILIRGIGPFEWYAFPVHAL